MSDSEAAGAGQGMFRRALNSGAVLAGSYAVSQVVRLGSNLILTRLLFPEAFGIMALVFVVLQGCQLFSDVGIGPAINRSPRGDEPAFLDTAWTVNVLRGAVLWLVACAFAWPLALFYEVPELAYLVPVGALSLLIGGLYPTRIDTAHRHLLLLRVTMLDLLSQILGVVVMIVIAWATGSIWALVWGSVLTVLFKLLLCYAFLPGRSNRLHWDRSAVTELVHFGKWILISTACGFLLLQGDKAILGAWLSMAELGHYNIGWFLGSSPLLMAQVINGRIMVPLCRAHPPGQDAVSDARLRSLRYALTLGTIAMLAVLAFAGDWLASVLYDARYADVGAIVTAVALALMPMIIGMTYDQAALAAGDGRGFFLLQALRALVQTAALLAGTALAGLGGALTGFFLAQILGHGGAIWLARRHKAWDPRHDLICGFICAGLITAVFLWRGGALAALIR